MKLKEVLYLCGLKPKPRRYGYQVRRLDLPSDGAVDFAVWEHPGNRTGWFDQGCVDELRRYLRPGDTAIDIGAQVGDTTVPMALAVGPQGTVFALEPNGYVFPVLEANARLNEGRTRIVPLPFAATETDGDYVFQYSDNAFSNGGLHEGIGRLRHGHMFDLKVQGRNLSAYLERHHPRELERLRFIKVDAESYDAAILESLSEWIARTRPYIRAEVYRHLDRAGRHRLYDAIARHGYTVHRLRDLHHYRGPVLGRDDLEDRKTFDIFGVPSERTST